VFCVDYKQNTINVATGVNQFVAELYWSEPETLVSLCFAN
jgi:hypothetical protein